MGSKWVQAWTPRSNGERAKNRHESGSYFSITPTTKQKCLIPIECMKFSPSLPHSSAITKVCGGWQKPIKASTCALVQTGWPTAAQNVFMCPTVKYVPASYLLKLPERWLNARRHAIECQTARGTNSWYSTWYSVRLKEVTQFQATLECLFATTFGHLRRILVVVIHEGTQACTSTTHWKMFY